MALAGVMASTILSMIHGMILGTQVIMATMVILMVIIEVGMTLGILAIMATHITVEDMFLIVVLQGLEIILLEMV
jgi:hypothetical protein